MRALALIIALTASPALASAQVNFSGDYFLSGFDLGGTFDGDGIRGGVFGVELSIARLDSTSGFWWGGLGAAAWDGGVDQLRFTVGPEIGWAMIGTELGISIDGAGTLGGRARVVCTVALVALYVGSGFDEDGARGEFGVLFKVPLEFSSLRDR